MADPVVALIFVLLLCALLTASLMPAPRRLPANADALYLALLGAAGSAAILMGVLALGGQAAPSAVLGVTAWVIAMPCVWLARAPRPEPEWADEGEEDDDGGSPGPDGVPHSPASGERPQRAQPAAVAATYGRTRAVAAAPAALFAQAEATPVLIEQPCRTAGPHRSGRTPRGRVDHRSIVHLPADCRPGRRRSTLVRRLLRRSGLLAS